MNQGFIQLHRNILEWEWYTTPNVLKIFIHCLLKANHSDKNWKGIEIKRGAFISSIEQLSVENGLSVQQVRTAIEKLIATNCLTKSSHSRYTVFTVVNYDYYQSSNKLVNKQITNKQQTNNKQITTTNNDNNDNNVNNDNKIKDILSFLNECCGTRYRPNTKKTQSLINARLREGYTVDDFKTVILKKSQEWINDETMIKYLRPETLFGNKFESYLNQKATVKKEWSYNFDLIDEN